MQKKLQICIAKNHHFLHVPMSLTSYITLFCGFTSIWEHFFSLPQTFICLSTLRKWIGPKSDIFENWGLWGLFSNEYIALMQRFEFVINWIWIQPKNLNSDQDPEDPESGSESKLFSGSVSRDFRPQCCGSGSKGSASFCQNRIHYVFHGTGSRSRSEPSSLPPPLSSSFTLNLLSLLPHPNSLIHHPSPLTTWSFTPPPLTLNFSPSYLIHLPSSLNTAYSPLLPHHSPFLPHSSPLLSHLSPAHNISPPSFLTSLNPHPSSLSLISCTV